MRVFIAGVMQGSRSDEKVEDQHYRKIITRVLQEHLDGVEIIDPRALHPNSETFGAEQARETFMRMNALAGQVDVLVAFVPQASMGTAIEMWEAFCAGVPVVTISLMTENWVVKLLSSRVLPLLKDFERFVADGALTSLAKGE
jgi:hypothetical protein